MELYKNDADKDENEFTYEERKKKNESLKVLHQLLYYFGLFYWTLPYPKRETLFNETLRKLGFKNEGRNLFQISEQQFFKLLNISLTEIWFGSPAETPYRNFFKAALFFCNEHFLLHILFNESTKLTKKFTGVIASPNKLLSPEKQRLTREFLNA